jgi:hypothetical protein
MFIKANLISFNIVLKCINTWFRWLVASHSQRKHGFTPWSVHAGFAVDKVSVGQVFLGVLPLLLSLSFHRCSPHARVRWGINNKHVVKLRLSGVRSVKYRVVQRFGKHCSCHPEGNVYRNVGQLLIFNAAHSRKPKFYTESQPRKSKNKNRPVCVRSSVVQSDSLLKQRRVSIFFT